MKFLWLSYEKGRCVLLVYVMTFIFFKRFLAIMFLIFLSFGFDFDLFMYLSFISSVDFYSKNGEEPSGCRIPHISSYLFNLDFNGIFEYLHLLFYVCWSTSMLILLFITWPYIISHIHSLTSCLVYRLT